ncbi:hypothetical protein B0T19DRAFT_398355 [Cercophora scortea]|uniref:Uncharacterized protein n=1 Tax=Cercophora scortea TaxID=314031 RepID=A0AAE0IWM4_9PEZI|nr:hypothetical protein B0T19DRAFT_398355 [Cercophora scortea]
MANSTSSDSETIAQLQQRLQDLETENAWLRSSCNCHQPSPGTSHDNDNAREQEQKGTAGTRPSYMRPTQSSQSRAQAIAQEKARKQAEDLAKKLDKVRVDDNVATGRPTEAGLPSNAESWGNGDGVNNGSPADQEVQPQAPISDWEYTARVDTWEGTQESKMMRISTKFSLDILTQAHQLVKESVHDAAQRFWPHLAKSRWPEGPHLVKLGFTESRRWIQEIGYVTRADPIPHGITQGSLDSAIMDAAGLRNACAHPSLWELCNPVRAEKLIRCGENVLEVLGDQARIDIIQALRKDIRDEAQRVYDRITSTSTEVDESEEWPPHCELTLALAFSSRLSEYESDRYPDPVVDVAKAWADEKYKGDNEALFREYRRWGQRIGPQYYPVEWPVYTD